ncbi:MAG: putative maltokinase [Candidatus Hydrogenedentota bacterium]
MKIKQILVPELKNKLNEEAFIKYLKGARWFGGKGRTIRKIRILESVLLKVDMTEQQALLVIEVNYIEGAKEKYLLPLFLAYENRARIITERFPHSIITHYQSGGKECVLYDGVYDERLHQFLFEIIYKSRRIEGKSGEFVGYKGKGFRSFLKLPLESYLLSVEQSNTSIVYRDTFILKLFRRITDGINPDAELIKALTEKTNFSYVPHFAGAIEYRCRDLEPIFIGLLQDFVANQGDAWIYTLNNVSKYFKSLSESTTGITSTELSSIVLDKKSLERFSGLRKFIGESFLKMIALLGDRTARLHLALSTIDNQNFIQEPFSKHYKRFLYRSMNNLVREVFRLLDRSRENFTQKIKSEVSKVLSLEGKILERLGKINEKKIQITRIRIHGDYHLGQVLFTGNDFVIIDFEGEPARPLKERKMKHSVVRDIAGMIRSFHYAVYSGLLKEGSRFLEAAVKLWYFYVSSIFLCAYLETAGDAPFLPQNKDEFIELLEIFLLEKAVYELGYELNNRPDWVIIPIKGIMYILWSDSRICQK